MSDDTKSITLVQPPHEYEASSEDMDQRIELLDRGAGRVPRHMSDAVTYVHDTMETAWLSARVVFGRSATPDHALAIFDRINAERLRLVAQADAEIEAAGREQGNET